MVDLDPVTALKWLGVLTTALGVGGGMLRLFVLARNASKTETAVANGTTDLLENLQKEVVTLRNRINQLEATLMELMRLEAASAHDFGTLEATVANMPCNECKSQGRAFIQLNELVARMRTRREKREAIIRAGGVNNA